MSADLKTSLTIGSDAPSLVPLQQSSPELIIITRLDPQFESLRSVYNLDLQDLPLAICRPKNETEVSAIVLFCSSSHIPITVRSGGHDLWGRSTPANAVVIDVRSMNCMELSTDKNSVRIGGGTLAQDLVEFLDSHGRVVATGFCATVGYVSWATGGGYGLSCGALGMGADQIFDARIVLPNGQITDANDELLWGLRGGGCNFGVVVSMSIKTVLLPQILAGFIIFPWAESTKVLNAYSKLLEEDHPRPFSPDITGAWMPGVGNALVQTFAWFDSDIEQGQLFLEKITGLGTVIMNTVAKTTLHEYMQAGKAFSPPTVHMQMHSILLPSLRSEFFNQLVENPPPENSQSAVIVHFCHGAGAAPNSEASFSMRRPHILVEIIGAADTADNTVESYSWEASFYAQLKASGLALEGGYPNLMAPNEDPKSSFGANWTRLVELKRKYDAENVFSSAIPRLV